MAKVKVSESSVPSQRQRPALTPEARENQMIALAEDCAEKQLMDGTASPSVIVHYLKLATVREQLERERLRKENELLEAKTESLRAAERVEELYANAIKAMQKYSGHGDPDEY